MSGLGKSDYEVWDLTALPANAVPRTDYQRAISLSEYRLAHRQQWVDYDAIDHNSSGLIEGDDDVVARPYVDFYRIAWRRRIASNTERSLFSALIPPGPAHIHGVISMALRSIQETALNSGFWASLVFDYILRLYSKEDFLGSDAQSMPAADLDHPLAQPLLLRALRLNCLTEAYGSIWELSYDADWLRDDWAYDWGLNQIGSVDEFWSERTPLRSEYSRRAALIEIDCIVAAWLGISADDLIAIYESRFPVLSGYEREMYFDSSGRQIGRRQKGFGQPPDAWGALMAFLSGDHSGSVPSGYFGPFRKAERATEYRVAHAAFVERMRQASSFESRQQRGEGGAG
ncbi:hypothetical protein [Nocardia sp. NPDC004722]